VKVSRKNEPIGQSRKGAKGDAKSNGDPNSAAICAINKRSWTSATNATSCGEYKTKRGQKRKRTYKTSGRALAKAPAGPPEHTNKRASYKTGRHDTDACGRESGKSAGPTDSWLNEKGYEQSTNGSDHDKRRAETTIHYFEGSDAEEICSHPAADSADHGEW